MTWLLVWCVFAAAEPPLALPSEETILRTLRAEHPRLIAAREDAVRLKKLLADDPRAATLYRHLKAQADKLLAAEPVEHKLVGPRLLGESRKCLARIYTLATVYRLEGERRYLDRAAQEMLAAAAFADWNPAHFLDTAEMTHALAIGYDWLYDDLLPAHRDAIRRAIVEKGLRPAEAAYRKRAWWTQARHNWNQVCNGGIALGALAIAEDEPRLAAYLLRQAVESLPRAMAEFAPDGAWGEGPSYWNYATSYNVYLLAGLETALGTDFGLSGLPGFSRTGDFRMHMVGPTGETFNFADGGSTAGQAPQMFWLARKFDQPHYAWHERELMRGGSALHLWWFDGRGGPPTDFPAARHFQHVEVVAIRGAWNDRRAVFVGLKGGDNKVNHSHLELGAFVLEADGQRWAIDLGADDYNLPAYFGRSRWSYYRLGTAGQNTLLFDDKNQDAKAVAPVIAFHATPARAHAVVDLSAAYVGQAKSVRRGMAMLDRRMVLLQDEIEGTIGRTIAWQMHTRAKIEVSGDRATLTQAGEKLTARLLAPDTAKFNVESAAAPRPQNPNTGVSKLVVKLPASPKPLRLAVLFVPGSAAAEPPSKLVPLAHWQKDWQKD